MEENYKRYFKVLNHPLFGGTESEGYMSIFLSDKEDNPIDVIYNIEKFTDDENVKYIEISKEEYLNATEE